MKKGRGVDGTPHYLPGGRISSAFRHLFQGLMRHVTPEQGRFTRMAGAFPRCLPDSAGRHAGTGAGSSATRPQSGPRPGMV